MPSILKYFWGNPSPLRLALSFAVGVSLGLCFLGSPIWFIILTLVLILRSHIISVVLGFCFGKFLSIFLIDYYENIGKQILLSHKEFWQEVLIKPFICYLQLNRAAVMGNLFFSMISLILILIIIFPILHYFANYTFKKYILRHSS